MYSDLKVYPALGPYIKEHQYNRMPIMELYDMQNERIEYISSMNLPKEFFDDFLKSKKRTKVTNILHSRATSLVAKSKAS